VIAVLATVFMVSSFLVASTAPGDDPGRIDVTITPYYDSSGPTIRIGQYSGGLASKDEATFVSTVLQMKRQWSTLNFVELYVGAIRLYDLGYRREATYWFYSAQYRGRQFALLVDQKKMGGIGDRAFELYHAQDAFFQLVGPNINGYAFGDVDFVSKIARRVQTENKTVPKLQTIYPGVAFISPGLWQQQNAEVNAGLGTLALSVTRQKAEIQRQRAKNGTQARFSQLTTRQFPGGL
jgi:hypothetical protein